MPQRSPLILVALAGCVIAAACTPSPEPDRPGSPQVLRISAAWRDSVPPEEFEERTAALRTAIGRLRDETRTGWIGIQDDVTGFLAELTGGSYPTPGGLAEAAEALLEDYAAPLFGVEPAALAEADPAPPGAPSIRLGQRVGPVPVLDATLNVAATGAPARLRLIRGRVFPGLDVETEPGVTPDAARRIARRESRGLVRESGLVVIPVPAPGTLAYRVMVAAPEDPRAGGVTLAEYLLDASSGDVIEVRAASAERLASPGARAALRRLVAQAPPQGESVDLTGVDPIGEPVTGKGIRGADGRVHAVDTTLPWYDPASGAGAITTHDATGLGLTEDNHRTVAPGPIAAFDGTAVGDPDVLGAHVFGRYVLDYFWNTLQRRSWDGNGVTLISTVNTDFGCNAFFQGTQMVYGDTGACPENITDIDIDTAGHEIAHGVTGSSAKLLYEGQSGALNEAFSDYFGNVIGNLYNGTDSVTLFEDGCVGFEGESGLCTTRPDGLKGLRYMLEDANFDEFWSFLEAPPGVDVDLDNGGVHTNSFVWNNALWSVRTRLAQMDGVPGNDSARARAFDTVVYRALATLLSAQSGFLDARRALEQAAVDLAVDPVILQVIRETLDAKLICETCLAPRSSPAVPVARGPARQVAPSVAGEQIVWMERTEGSRGRGSRRSGDDGPRPVGAEEPSTSAVVAGPGAAAVMIAEPPRLVRVDLGTETLQEVAAGADIDQFVGLAGSDEGAAWITGTTVNFLDAAGQVTSAPFQPGDLVTAIGTGGRTVAVGTRGGRVIVWRVGSEPTVVELGGQPVVSVAAHGNRLVTVQAGTSYPAYFSATVKLHDLDTSAVTTLSENATGQGAAVTPGYAVWTEKTGDLTGEPAADNLAGGAPMPDTTLYLHSFATGVTYDVLPGVPGQQGYPAIAGDRLVWQDSVAGADDIYTGRLPEGL